MNAAVMLVLGAGLGLGVLLIWRAFAPRPTPIAAILSDLAKPGAPIGAEVPTGDPVIDRVGSVSQRIVEAFGQVLGQELPVRFVAPGEPIPGLPDIAPPLLAGMETYDSPVPMAETARTFGVQMTPLASTIRGMLGAPGA